MPDIYLFRHAHVDYDASLGITALNPLTPLGQEMAARLAERCDAWDLEHLFVSSMLRARQTAEAVLARHPSLPHTRMDDLQETNPTDLAGYEGPMPDQDLLTWDEHHFAYANGTLWRRVARARARIECLVHEQRLDRIGIVSHGAVMNALIRQWLGQPVAFMQSHWIEFGWCSVSCIHLDRGVASLRSVNDTRHVESQPTRDAEGQPTSR